MALSVAFCGSLRAQEETAYTEFLPPAPTAAELGKYGLMPPVASSGVPGIDVPLYNYSTTYINVPISLSYHSDGIKVDQVASWVGLSWSLNAGGVITRIVKGRADDSAPPAYPDNIAQNNVQTVEYLRQAMDGEIDTEPDLFAFNFMGYTGKFIYDREGVVHVMPHQNIKIERTINPNEEAGEFKVTTTDGVQYFFGGANATELTITSANSPGCGKEYSLPEETAFYLTRILHPTGEEINFTYTSYGYSYTGGVTQTLRINTGIEGCTQGHCPGESINRCESRFLMKAVRLSGISSPNYGSVNFYSPNPRADLAGDYELDRIEVNKPGGALLKTFKFDYEYSINPRLFLMGVDEVSPNPLDQVKRYTFEYHDKDALPARLSYSQDHWGYFNGADNEYLFPKDNLRPDLFDDRGGDRGVNPAATQKGILKKITYPTGGYTEYSYEQNTVYSKKTVTDETPVNIELKTMGGPGEIGKNTVTETIFMPNQQRIRVVGGASYDPRLADPNLGCDTLKAKALFWITNVTNNTPMIDADGHPIIGIPCKGFDKYLIFLPNKKYELKVTVVGECTAGGITLTYNDQKSYEVEANINVGGLRVKKITNYDPGANHEEVKVFHYAALASLSESSGELSVDPKNTYYTATESVVCDEYPCEVTCRGAMLYSNSLKDLYANGTGHIAYEYVTVSHGENFEYGGEEQKFIIQHNNQNRRVKGDIIMGTPYTNIGWNHGLLKISRKFKMIGDQIPVILYEKHNNYEQDSRHYVEVPALIAKKKVEGICHEKELTITCDGTDRSIYGYVCITNHDHMLHTGTRGWRCIAFNSDNRWRRVWTSPCHDVPAGQTIVLHYQLDNINAMEYGNISWWHYLDYSTETFYDDNGANPIVKITYYQYDNPEHLQLTYTKTERSGEIGEQKDISETYIRYPDDYTVPGLQTLKDKHIVGVPVKTEKVINGNQVEGQVIDYNDYGQPQEVHRYQSNTLKPPLTHHPAQIDLTDHELETSIIYNPQTHRIEQIEQKGDREAAYLWGYNQTEPIAEVKNATAEQVYHTSFEETGFLDAANAKTGQRYHNSGSFSIPASFNPASTGNLKMSYWYWDGSAWIFSGELDFSRSISSAGTRLDEIRVYPAGALMTTYTYDLGVGLLSKTDANNLSSYYTYDGLGRLIGVADHEHRPIQKYEYHYAGQ
ncbi:hypothetical protein LVD17_13820 [Fulvivirga ulvae]|uniref:hypothetical protein n=1 Tax=Fulvivirga ulvae TaxID=2904245 RepID=UPI001F197ABB|nr:hypothetical protein [Fulvivirga ulvae]UII34885.1 hypothetical protein LVD17_13820 [Fulvivirga ulvae]